MNGIDEYSQWCYLVGMVLEDEIRQQIRELIAGGWTLAAVADKLEIHYTTLARWRNGTRYPENARSVLLALTSLSSETPPPKRRYPGGHYLQRRAAGKKD